MKKIASNLLAVVIAVTALAAVLAFAACGEPTITDIQLMMGAEKEEYVVGETFDKTGIVLTAIYSDGTRKEITDYTIDKTGPLTLSDTEVTITYQDKTFKQPIKVIELGEKVVLTTTRMKQSGHGTERRSEFGSPIGSKAPRKII